jgi:hypothetical protein
LKIEREREREREREKGKGLVQGGAWKESQQKYAVACQGERGERKEGAVTPKERVWVAFFFGWSTNSPLETKQT